jgi:hemerythrin superfamily protein
MSTRKVIKNLEAAIDRICEDIKKKKGGSGADKLDSLAKLVNSYGRLIEQKKEKDYDKMMDGNPNYYKRLLKAGKQDMKGVLR